MGRHDDARYGGGAPENYERYFVPAIGRPVALDLIRAAAPAPGEQVLDVACGTGVVARMAAERVCPGGRVEGLDVNPGMIDAARRATPPRHRITWHVASAEAMPLPDAQFDLATCQMGLQFMPDKATALKEVHRVLRPGGRFALNVPGPMPSLLTPLHAGLARHVGPEAAAFVRDVFVLNDVRELEGLLAEAGFRATSIQESTKALRLPGPRDFLWQYIHSTPLAGLVETLDAERREALEAEVVAAWEEVEEDGALPLRVRVLLATALA